MTPAGPPALADAERTSNPFPGLRPFEFGESHLYFGRDGQSDQLIRKLAATRFVAVVGTSGSGKSSLVRAGLLPDLFSGFMPGAGTHWRVCLMRPSNDPLGNLARALNSTEIFGSDDEENRQIQTAITEATLRRGGPGLVEVVRQNRMAPNESLLVVVDQFEELFRFARVSGSEQYRYEAAAFVKLLLEAARQREQNVYVVLTMRSDFLGDCSIFWGLPEAVNEGQYLIPRMTRDQRAEAVTGPVAVCGGGLAQRLVNRLLNDTGDNPDMLPILQHALMRTWENWAGDHAEGEPIDLRHYEAVGTMADALSRHADEALDELPDARGREIAERVFKALTEKGEDNREVRRPTVLGELCAQVGATLDEVVPIIEVFRREGRSFLMPPAAVPLDEKSLIDISHESLIRNWGRLKEWVEQESGCAQIYRRLAETAVLHGRGEAGLWRDPDLQLGLEWRGRHKPPAAWATRYHPAFGPAMKFLEASVAARDAAALEEEHRRRREIKRTRRAAVFFFLLFMSTLAAFLYAYYARDRVEAAATRNQQLLYADDLKLAQQAYDAGNVTRARELLDAHAPGGGNAPGFEWHHLRHLLHAETGSLSVELSDGHKLKAAVPTDGGKKLFVNKGDAVELWDLATRRKLRSIDIAHVVHATAVSPDGRLLAFAGESWLPISLVDVSTKEVPTLRGEGETERVPKGIASVVGFSPDGATLAVGTELYGDDSQPQVTLWDVASRRRKAVLPAKSTIVSIAFSPDGKRVAASQLGGGVLIRNVASGSEVCTAAQGRIDLSSIAYSHDGTMFAGAEKGGQVRIWRGDCDGTPLYVRRDTPADSPVSAFAFSPDDRLLAVTYVDSGIKIFAAPDYQTEVAAFKGHGSYINSVAFLPDNQTLVTAAENGTVNLWDASARILEHKTLSGHESPVSAVAFSPDGGRVATGGVDERMVLWDAGTREVLKTFDLSQSGQVHAVTFSPDGQMLVAGAAAKRNSPLRIWDATSFEELTPFGLKYSQIFAVAFSPDGRRVVGGGRGLFVWDASSRTFLNKINDENTSYAAFSRDGRLFAAAQGGDAVRLWDGELKKELKTFGVKGVTSLAFSPDGRVLAVSFEQGTVKLLDTDTGAGIYTLSGHNGRVLTVTFSPDGRTLATGGEDASVKLWSTTSFKELVTLGGHTGAINALAFSPDGRTLASTGFDKTVRLWRTATDEEVKSREGASR